MRTIAVIVMSVAGLFGIAAGHARASTVDLHWSAPADCPSQESLRVSLAKRLGAEVTFGADAPLQVLAEVTARAGGYELQLRTRSQTQANERRLQARSCGELARATLLITSVLLGADAAGEPSSATEVEQGASAAPSRPTGVRSETGVEPGAARAGGERPERAEEPRTTTIERTDQGIGYVFARCGAVAELGSLAAVSGGIGIALGVGLGATRLELSGSYLPSRALSVPELPGVRASLQLLAASAGVCREFFAGPTFAPCLRLEVGRLRGQAQGLPAARSADALWLAAMLGAALGVRLLEPVFLHAALSAGLPLSRPRFAIAGAGTLHEVPAVVGRFELSLEARF